MASKIKTSSKCPKTPNFQKFAFSESSGSPGSPLQQYYWKDANKFLYTTGMFPIMMPIREPNQDIQDMNSITEYKWMWYDENGKVVIQSSGKEPPDEFEYMGQCTSPKWTFEELPPAIQHKFPKDKFHIGGVYRHNQLGLVFPIMRIEQVGTDRNPTWYDSNGNKVFETSYVPGWTPGKDASRGAWHSQIKQIG